MASPLAEPVRLAPSSPGEVDEERVTSELSEALTDHLLTGRPVSDVGQALLALLTTFVFWESGSTGLLLTWLGAVLAAAAARALYRSRVVSRLREPRARMRRLRIDVWISAALWGFGGPLLIGSSETHLAFLLLIFAGLIAAATSTVVGDRPAFFGFTALLLVPMAVAVALGGLTRDQLSLLLMTVLFAPFMTAVHGRAHRILKSQLEAQSRLRMSEAIAAQRTHFLTSLIDAAPNPIAVLDPEGRILRINPAFEQAVGATRSHAVGEPLTSLTDAGEGRERLEAFLSRVLAGERSVVEVQLRREDDTLIWMRMSGTTSAEAGVGAALLIGEDVTAQVALREAQESARAAAEESARAKSQFLASMSHEIRTPMNGVMGMIELLLDTDLDEQQMGWADVLRTSADDLLTILNDILDVSKIEAGQLKLEVIDFDLRKLLSESGRAFAPRAAQSGLELVLDIAQEVPHFVKGDPVRIRQILNNLLSNAFKFTEAGEITLAVSSESEGDAPERGRVRFAVRDTGIGIPEEKRDMIFEEFSQADASTTRRYGGTGLGLAICRRLVHLMEGTLRVDSELGAGSEFSFELLLPVGAAQATRSRATAPLDRRRVLVIDDNAAARRIVRGAVESEGGVVDEADGGRAGIAMIESSLGTVRAYDVVVLDSLMPDMDGFAVADAVSKIAEERRPALLMLTSAATGDEPERARSLHVRGLLEKPASRFRLVQAIGMLLAPGREDGRERRMVTSRTLGHLPKAGRILFADDSKVNHHVAVAMLGRRGYAVDVVENGRAAVEVALATDYDLVLMDVEMPVMDGIAATREIRRHKDADTLPIVAVTAHALSEQEAVCREAGMNDFLSKPFKAHALYSTVERWSGGQRAPAGAPGAPDAPPREDGPG